MNLLAEEEGVSNLLTDERQVSTASGKVPKIAVGGVPSSSRSANLTQPNVLRTVYLPNEQVGAIKSENDKLNN